MFIQWNIIQRNNKRTISEMETRELLPDVQRGRRVKDTWSFHKNLSGSVSASVKPGTQNRRSKYLPFRIPELFYLLVSLKMCPSPSPLAFHTLNNDTAEFSTLLFLTFKRATCIILDLSWAPLHYAYPFGASLSPTFCSLSFQGNLFFSHLSLLCS